MDSIIFTMALTVTVGTASELFAIELNEAFSFEAVNAMAYIAFVLALMYAYCSASERVTSYLLDVGEMFYNSAWYQLPVKQQKLLVLPIQRAEREFRLSGLGLFDCSLAVFSSVSNFISQ